MTRFVYEDPITKGASYAKFMLEIAKQHNTQGYLVMMDITNFNNITIAAGKAAGENMIRDTWKIISKELRTEEIAAHIRDDVFILFLVVPNGSEVIDRMEVISGHISEKAKKLHVYGIHAGYGIYRMDGSESFEDAYSKAKVAREHALTQPELHYAFYDEINHQKQQEEKQLGLHITAEGVENQGQLKFLQGLKCDDIQGFYFAKPMPGTEYEAML